MKKTLTTALKKSLSAEQQTVAAKNPNIKPIVNTDENMEVKEVIKNIKQTSQKSTVAKPTPETSTAEMELETVNQKTPQPLPIMPATHRLLNEFTEPSAYNFGIDNLTALTDKNQELATTVLDAISGLNQDITDYIASCTQITNINELMKLNMALITQLTTKQKLFIEQTMLIMTSK